MTRVEVGFMSAEHRRCESKGVDRLSIGVGMIPRGEVGLIFASIGSQLTVKGEAVVDPKTFSAVVVMVIVTTMVTPPLLKWSLNRKRVAV